MINMKISNDELLANATHAAMHLVDNGRVYVLDELAELAGSTCSGDHALDRFTLIGGFVTTLCLAQTFRVLLLPAHHALYFSRGIGLTLTCKEIAVLCSITLLAYAMKLLVIRAARGPNLVGHSAFGAKLRHPSYYSDEDLSARGSVPSGWLGRLR